METKMTTEVNNIREQYFEYPTKPMKPQEVVDRQNIYYLLGVIDALIMKGAKE